MKYIYIPLTILFLLAAKILNGQETPVERGIKSITQDVIKAQTGFLASDWTEGRAAGEKGERLASDYIASMLQLFGVKPYGDMVRTRYNSGGGESVRTYFQNFVLLKTVPGEEQILQVRSTEGKTITAISFTRDVDFTIRPSDPAFEITAPVVFAGYAYRNDELRYNDLAKLDLKGKFVLKISGFPKFVTESTYRSRLTRESQKMDSIIRSMGAVGIIEFSPEEKVTGRPEIPDFMNMSPSEAYPWSGKTRASYRIPGAKNQDVLRRLSVSVKSANEILKGTNIDIDAYLEKANINQVYNLTQPANKEIYLKTNVSTTQVAVRNVIGIIEGNKPDQVIVLGAHYDHVGMGNGYIWNGADDNASGTVGIMTLAKAIMETGQKPEKTIIIALWTAEEVGLLGSRYYLENLSFPLENIKLNLNFDMISRYINDSEPDKVTMTYDIEYPLFRDITVSNLNKYGIDLSVDYQPSANPPGGSDHRSFVAKGIPIMRFKPGHREEYHMPDDEISTLDWDIMEKIIKISYANIWELANSDWESK